MTSGFECVRAWDSVVVLDYLEGNQRSREHYLEDIVST